MISCEKAVELSFAAQDRPLSIGERIRFHFHLAMCSACKAFEKQNRSFARLFELRFRAPRVSSGGTELPQLPPEACERIKQQIQTSMANADGETNAPDRSPEDTPARK